jgi:hypothetical protein
LRSADIGRIIRESTDTVSDRGRNSGEDVAGQLHSVTGIAREADNDLIQFFNCHNLVKRLLILHIKASQNYNFIPFDIYV